MSYAPSPSETAVEPEIGVRIGSISVLAVASLVLSLASVLGCITATVVGWMVTPAALVAILALPVPALGGAVLGGISLRNIKKARGKVGGRTMAIIGLFVGLIAAVLQASIAISALATYWPVKQQVTPVVQQMAAALASDDLTAARQALSPSASQVVSDQRLRRLLAPSAQQYGPFVEATFGLDVFVDSFQRVRESAQRAQATGGPGLGGPGVAPKPVGLRFARGSVIAYVFVDQGAIEQGRVEILDILVTPQQGPATTLLPDGPAVQAARSLGLAVAEVP